MLTRNIEIPEEAIQAFCERNCIRYLALFGSVLRDDFTSESDVDVLVEFQPGERVGLFRFDETEEGLSNLLRHKVDLNTKDMLSRYFADEVLAEAEPIYVAP